MGFSQSGLALTGRSGALKQQSHSDDPSPPPLVGLCSPATPISVKLAKDQDLFGCVVRTCGRYALFFVVQASTSVQPNGLLLLSPLSLT